MAPMGGHGARPACSEESAMAADSVEDLGAPASYLTLQEGCRCYSSDGEDLGKVAHVLADPDVDLFDGFVLDTSVLPGSHRFVDADQVASIHERGVVLAVDA